MSLLFLPPMSEPYHTLDITEPYRSLLGGAISGSFFLLLDLSTGFSRKVFASLFLTVDEIEDLRKRFKEAGDEMELSEKDVELVYTCHFIHSSFAQDREAFFKWFMENEEKANNVSDSEDFRKVTAESHSFMAATIEKSNLWTDALQKKKQKLVELFGDLPSPDMWTKRPE
ncbi:MAG: hypothetical protein JJE25_09700 [Bacteroidia bacterium]|nr:hypothetical protein [Bacteroidia bacterium]